MTRDDLLELWELRFHKILQLEAEAHKAYKLMLKNYSHILVGSRLKPMLREIMSDEKRHVQIALELLKIVEAKRSRRRKPVNDPK